MNAAGLPLKTFSAPKAGVLEFDCGDQTNAIGTLTLGSFGTVRAHGTAPGSDNTSALDGRVGAIKIAGDFGYGSTALGGPQSHHHEVQQRFHWRRSQRQRRRHNHCRLARGIGSIGSIKIGGNVIGGSTAVTREELFYTRDIRTSPSAATSSAAPDFSNGSIITKGPYGDSGLSPLTARSLVARVLLLE